MAAQRSTSVYRMVAAFAFVAVSGGVAAAACGGNTQGEAQSAGADASRSSPDPAHRDPPVDAPVLVPRDGAIDGSLTIAVEPIETACLGGDAGDASSGDAGTSDCPTPPLSRCEGTKLVVYEPAACIAGVCRFVPTAYDCGEWSTCYLLDNDAGSTCISAVVR